MKEEKINVNAFKIGPSEEVIGSSHAGAPDNAVGTAGCAAAPSRETGRGVWMRRTMVSCLLGSLLLMLAMLAVPSKSSASVGIFVSFGPPALPVYEQPPIPAPGYIWTPGYWAWDPYYGYYWVPGTWVPAPFLGAVWTPGYWGWDDDGDGYVWYPGYWGTEVGFYGGINYGYGYPGQGYYGGQWRGDRFYYNREVTHITNVNIVNVYQQRVVVNNDGPRISYNGGRDGINARPTSREQAAERSRRMGAINQQLQQRQVALNDPAQRARENHGRPEIAATMKPGEFHGNGVVRATRAGAPYKEPPRNANNGQPAGRSKPAPVERGPAVNAPRPEAAPNNRMERGVPAQPRNERPPQARPSEERGTTPQQRNEPSVNQNNRPPEVQRNQRESQPPQARPNEGGAHAQPRNEAPMNRQPEMQRSPRESRAPQARPNEGRGAQERQARPNEGRRGDGNNNNDNHNHPPQR